MKEQIIWISVVLLFNSFTLLTEAHGPVHKQIQQLSQQIEANPDSLFLYCERGLLYKIDENVGEAIADFEKVLALNQTITTIYLPLAELYVQQEKWTKAQEMLQTHLDHFPNLANGYQLFAKIHLVHGALPKAKKCLEKVIELKGDYVTPDDYIDLSTIVKKENAEYANKVLLDGCARFGRLITLQTKIIELAVENHWYERSIDGIDQILIKAPRKEYWLLQKAILQDLEGECNLAKKNYQNCLTEIAGLKPKTKSTDYVQRIKRKAELALQYF